MFAAGAGRQINNGYINDGDVRLGYWHFAFLSPSSFLAAEASECAADQDAFWSYHDAIYDSLAQNKRQLSNEDLNAFAAQLGLDTDEFSQCLDSRKYKELVEQQTDLGRQIGVSSTPAFLINGTPVLGAQPFENFKQVIDSHLEQ